MHDSREVRPQKSVHGWVASSLFVVLLLLWAGALLFNRTMHGLIHLLLIAAIVLLILRLHPVDLWRGWRSH